MSAKDLYHDVVRKALEDEGWTITADPLTFRFLGVELRIDLGAERVLAAERNEALGQYIDYREGLLHKDLERLLYLAVPLITYETFFRKPFGEYMTQRYELKLIVYSPESKVIVQWLP